MRKHTLVTLLCVMLILTSAACMVGAQTYPTPPRNLTMTQAADKTVLTWEPPESDGGSPVTGYIVEYMLSSYFTGGDSVWRIRAEDIQDLNYTFTDAERKPYTFRVLAENAFGVSLPSRYVGSPMGGTEAGVPRLVDEVNATRLSGTEMQVNWGSSTYDNGLPILGYLIQYWRARYIAEKQVIRTEDPHVYTCVIGDLRPSESYELHVAAYNRYGDGDYGETIFVGLPEAQARVRFRVYSGAVMVSGATIVVGSQTLTTDVAGEAISDYLSLGPHSFTVSKEGYADYSDEVTLYAGDGIRPVHVPLSTNKIQTSISLSGSQTRVDGARDDPVDIKGKITPPISVKLKVYLAGVPQGEVTTGLDGSFSTMISKPSGLGSYVYSVSFEGNEQYEASTVHSSFEVYSNPGDMCFIAVATLCSELSEEAQLLRSFRNNQVQSTFAGQSFMQAFHMFYYSWSPHIAGILATNEPLRGVTRASLYPLFAILRLASETFNLLAPIPELGVVCAGLVASALIAVVYFSPLALLWSTLARIRVKGSWLRVQSLALASTVLLMLLSWAIRFSPLMMLSTGAFVMLTISVSILAVLRLVGNGIQR